MSDNILLFATQYSIYSGYILFVSGVIGNIFNILTFTQLTLFRDNRWTFYLTIESISNFLFQLLNASITILTSIYGDDATGRSSIWCKFRYILGQTFVLTTYYTICFATIDQFLSTNYRYNLRQIFTLKLARILITVSVCLWISHSIALGSVFNIQPLFGCVISNPIWLQYSTYFFYPLLVGLLPISIAGCFAILAYRNVRHIVRRQIPIVRRRLDQQMTAMVLIRVIVFVCLALPYNIYRTYIINFPIPKSDPLKYAIGRLVQVVFFAFNTLNYTVSFYVFLISSSRFRRQVKLVLAKRYWRRWKLLCYSRHNQITPNNIDSPDSNMELEEG